jgi:predicted GH43/DUF377 family glycosyl hydrolase
MQKMFKWRKLGRVFDPREVDIEWMKDFAQAPSALLLDDRVRVYFACRPAADSNNQFVSYVAYVDFRRDDLLQRIGISRERMLPLGERGTFDEFGTNPASVIRNGEAVWMYYAGWTRCESVPFNAAIGLAISRDHGETFQRIGNGPVLSYSFDEPFVIGSPRIRKFNGTMYLWYVAGKKWLKAEGRPEPVYKIRMATSADGLSWTKHGVDLIESILEEDECQASPDVFFSNGRYHMFFSFRHTLGFKDKGRGYHIGYAWSTDLLTWTRDDAKAGIEVSPEGWDSETISYPNVFELDGKTYMYYQGNQVGKFGFGLARLDV